MKTKKPSLALKITIWIVVLALIGSVMAPLVYNLFGNNIDYIEDINTQNISSESNDIANNSEDKISE